VHGGGVKSGRDRAIKEKAGWYGREEEEEESCSVSKEYFTAEQSTERMATGTAKSGEDDNGVGAEGSKESKVVEVRCRRRSE